MDSNKAPLNSNSNVPNRGSVPVGGHNPASPVSGGPNNGNFNNGNHNNYNRKKRQRHFGPSQPASPSNQAPKPVNAAGDNPNIPHLPRPNSIPIQTASGGNNPPRPKPPYPQNSANPPRNPNAPYPSSQQPRPQNRPVNSSANNRNSNNVNSSNIQGPGTRNIPQSGVQTPKPAMQNQAQRNDRPVRKWEDRMVKIEETYDDIRKDNERIEKEIWLEIAEIHNAKLD